jgi:hypothetical protein
VSERKLESWIGGFLEYSDGLPTTHSFRIWAAVSAISSALGRRCHTRITKRDQFANLYVLLVGPPGSGKTTSIFTARNLLRKVPTIALTPTRLGSPQALYDCLEDSSADSYICGDTGIPVQDHTLTAFIDEFSVFVRRGDLDFMADLADLYDCPDPFEYKVRHSRSNFAERSCFIMLGGCTTRHIRETFTEDALEGGFPARVIMVYCDEKFQEELFNEEEHDWNEELRKALVDDLATIRGMRGLFVWEEEAKKFFQGWVSEGMRPYPRDPKLIHYLNRRVAHITKLSMIISASRRDDMLVKLEDVIGAQKILLDAEAQMHNAIQFVGQNKYFPAQEAALAFILREYERTKRPVLEHRIRQLLDREVPAYLVGQIIDGFIAAQRVIADGTAPGRKLYPNDKGRAYEDGEETEVSEEGPEEEQPGPSGGGGKVSGGDA